MGRPKGNRRLPGKDRQKKAEGRAGKAAPRTGMARDIAAVLLGAAAVAGGLALATYSSLDGALIAKGFTPANLIGPAGHRLATGVYGVLGFSALVLPVGLGAAAWRLFRGAPPRITVVSALAYTALTLSVATLAHLALGARGLAPFPAGGAVGGRLARAVGGALLDLGQRDRGRCVRRGVAIVAADVKPRDLGAALGALAGALGRAARWSLGFAAGRVGAAIDEHRVAVAELRAEEAELRAAREAEAAALADEAEVEAADDDSREEARAVAGALAVEQLRRGAFEDPAWVTAEGEETPAGDEPGDDDAPAAEAEKPRRKRREKAAAEAGAAELAAPTPVPEPIPAPGPSAPPVPEIVVSQAMLERGRKKKKDEKKEAPAFAFTKAGDVFRLPSTELLDAHEEKAKAVDDDAPHPHRRGDRRDAEAARRRRRDPAHPARAGGDALRVLPGRRREARADREPRQGADDGAQRHPDPHHRADPGQGRGGHRGAEPRPRHRLPARHPRV